MSSVRYVAAVTTAALVGERATRSSAGTWYRRLRKPTWTPPSRVFGPVWTALYAQMAISAALVTREPPSSRRRRALVLWWLQLGLNASWSPVFFGRRQIGSGAVIVTALAPTVAATAVASERVNRKAGALFAPYVAWAWYAAALNLAIWRRNRQA